MVVKIHGKEYPLKKVFGEEFIFRIPPYQRPYSWTTEHAEELFEDLMSAMHGAGNSEPNPYFLGSVVLAKDENSPDAEVIDGQQRLTTLTILLAVIASRVTMSTKQHLVPFIRQEGNPLVGIKDVFRLTLRRRDADFFRRYVQEEEGLAKLGTLDPGNLPDPQRNVQANAVYFMERLDALTEPDRTALAQYLLNRCYLVVVSTPDTESAFRIFAVLNDRGLDLSHADIIKSELIGLVPDSDQLRYTDVWETAEEDLGVESFADLFSHIRMIYAKAKQRETLIKEFRSQVFPSIQDPRVFIDDVVAPFAEVYSRVLTQSWASASNPERINQTLGWLKRIDNTDWIPPAILFLNVHGQDSGLASRFLGGLERLAASMFIRRININGRIERYGALIKQIDNGDQVLADGSALALSRREKVETVRQLGGDLYLDRRTRGYVLLRLDEALSGGSARYEHRVISVEHVLPQTPPSDSVWLRWFDEAERERWVHRLANLLLLPRARNSAAQNYDFDKKKEAYFSDKDGTSPFAITSQVLKEHEWTPELLQTRQARLIQVLTSLWTLEQQDETYKTASQ